MTPRAPQVEHSTMEDDHFLFTSGKQLCSLLFYPLKGVSAGQGLSAPPSSDRPPGGAGRPMAAP
jgi:hypothetical protein